MKITRLIIAVLILTPLLSCFENWSADLDVARQKAAFDDGVRVFSDFPATTGLNIDAKILKSHFSTHASVTDQKNNPDSMALVNVFLEYVDAPFLRKAKYNWLVLNQELAPPASHLQHIDLVICKSRYATELMKAVRTRNQLTFDIVYTKFSTMLTNNTVPEANYDRDFNLAFHAAGHSPFKGTNSVLKAWRNDSRLPHLVVACRNYTDMRQGCKYVNGQEIFSHRYIKPSPKLEIFSDDFIPKPHFDRLMMNAGIFMVPSEMEGYGHSINEGRIQGAIVVTTDAPPMNELIQDGVNGILVPVHSKSLYNRHSGAERFSVRPDSIKQALHRIALMTPAQKREMGERARQSYEADTLFLKERIARLLASLKAKGDLSEARDILE